MRFPENEEASQLRLLQLELVREGQGCNLVGSAGFLMGGREASAWEPLPWVSTLVGVNRASGQDQFPVDLG